MLSFDPYDIWGEARLGRLKARWYAGERSAAIGIAMAALADWFAPVFLRKTMSVPVHEFAHVESMRLFVSQSERRQHLCLLRAMAACTGGWGLPFGWYSKNGVYAANTPYVTNTPYVMEALISIAADTDCRNEAMQLFHGTWQFIESLRVMTQSGNTLALSYAPVEEPRIVVNANAYAALAYALHAAHGRDEIRAAAEAKCMRLARWVVRQQQHDGSWTYYADDAPGNFIDCFHSCFVVKNLLKVTRLLPDATPLVSDVVTRGWAFIRERLFDSRAQLCRRFQRRPHTDPYRWDLYDQAEYLGLLVDFGLLDEATHFAERVERRFSKGEDWYCRIDIFGRRWGKNFYRWGIAPFHYHRARLDRAYRSETSAA